VTAPRERIAEFVAAATNLPVFPPLLQRVYRALDSGSSSAAEIAEIVESDQAMVARLLRTANSAFYSFRGRIATVRHAVVVLGHKTVRSQIMAIWTHSLREGLHGRVEYDLMARLFHHGLCCAATASLLGRRLCPGREEDLFVAALLHDIGRLALLRQLGAAYVELLAAAEQGAVQVTEVERERLGFDHAELGGELTRGWHLPDDLTEATARHHDEPVPPTRSLTLPVVILADVVATAGQANVALGAPRPSRPGLMERLGLPSEPEGQQAFFDECRAQTELLLQALR
jgi:HD-like signal output (HDOD) protein